MAIVTILDDILDHATDSSVSTSDLLRKVQIAAHRLGATEVIRWVRQELAGYEPDAELPPYRRLTATVTGTFAGPMRQFTDENLSIIPDGMEALWSAQMREPLTELQGLATLEDDPAMHWPAPAVKMYEESGVFRVHLFTLYRARTVITRQSLLGLIDIIRSKAMEFALELQSTYPDAGSVGGPTVIEPGVERVIYQVTNNIYGDGTNIATGSDIRQRSRVQKGDADALRRAAESNGLSAEDAAEFVAAVVTEQSLEGTRTSRFIDNVRNGAITLSGSIASDVAASGLIEIASSFLGL